VLFKSQSWLTVTLRLETTPEQFTVTANPTSPTILSPGPYQDTIQIIGQNNTILVPVSLTVSSIAVTPQTLSFATLLEATTSRRVKT